FDAIGVAVIDIDHSVAIEKCGRPDLTLGETFPQANSKLTHHKNARDLHPTTSTSFHRPLLTSSAQSASIAVRNWRRTWPCSDTVVRNNLLLRHRNAFMRRF